MDGSSSAPYVVGIDLGGTNARAVLARRNGTILGEVSHPSRSSGPPEGTMEVLATAVLEVMSQHDVTPEHVAGVGVGLPGIITAQNHCIWSPNFPHWKDVAIKDMLDARLSMPSFFLNDARCATLGELHYGAGRGVDSMVFVGLGTGIGGGIVMGGKLLLGRNGSVGEISHHTIDPLGPRCGCGNFGCWEAFCGRDYIVRRAILKLQHGRESVLRKEGRNLTPRDIADAAAQEDAVAQEVMEETGYYLGIGIANLINMLNPQRVVVGGGVAQAGELLLGPARRTVEARAVPFQASECEIVPAQLGSDAGVQGAVVLVLQRLSEGQGITI